MIKLKKCTTGDEFAHRECLKKLQAIDNSMPVIEETRGTPMCSVWIQCMRYKIMGDAGTVLQLYGTELSWLDIKTNLITHYSDKRDDIFLIREIFLFKLSQTGTAEEFYGKGSYITSLLLNQPERTKQRHQSIKKCFYEEMGLNVFLAGPLGPIIKA